MTIDRIKISQEINFNGMPTWIGIEGTLLPDEDTIEGLRTIQKKISEYQDEEQKAYTQSKWGKQEKPTSKQEMINKVKEDIAKCTTLSKEDNGLLSFEAIVKNTPELQDVYNETMVKITNKQ